MGTHVSGPSKIAGSNVSMKDHLNGQDLPFLFKVLSVRTALSIQAHPDKTRAAQLHASDPKNYRDPNHKPEMAIALSEFEALCGFRSFESISQFIKEIPVLGELLDANQTGISTQEELKIAFTRLMNWSPEQVVKAIQSMPKTFPESELFWRLNSQYPGDVGVFCVFFLNYLRLQPGEAVFLAANEPHAYISGSCVECMATSDNVVRAGLTPKHRDVKTLCEMLTYRTFSGSQELLTKPEAIAPAFTLYSSPVPEFSVLKVASEQAGTFQLPLDVGHSILLCLQGTAELQISLQKFALKAGSILYLPPNCKYSLKIDESFVAYQAFQPL